MFMIMFEEYIGKKFGKLTIIALDGLKKNGTPIFAVACECGSTFLKCGLDRLESGKTKDCGCSKRDVDLIGFRSGRLLIVEKTDKRVRHHIVWKCQCDCGNIFYAQGRYIKGKNLVSCGCIMKEKQHFAVNQPIHKIWNTIITRCYWKEHKFYYLYGGRGIRVCDEWRCDNGNVKAFSNFYDWAMANGYRDEKLPNGKSKYTIDRIDPDGDYCPENCRWITNAEQQRNKRADKLFTYNGETRTMKQWIGKYYVKCNDYYRLLFLGYDNKQILDFISSSQQVNINHSFFWGVHKERYCFTDDRKNIIDKFTNEPFDMNSKKFKTTKN